MSPETRSPAAPAPQPLRAGHMLMSELIDRYMADYTGRDRTRVQRLDFWKAQLGAMALQDVSDDHVHAGAQVLADQRGRFYAGVDANGKPIFRARRKPLSGPTINRYLAAVAAVFTWAIRKRIAPKGFVHPVRMIERHEESPGRLRFLSDDERTRLLKACQASKWDRLYLLVLMALTTGARKGELIGLRWRDIDFKLKVLHVGRSKNGQPKVLPLVGAVIEQLQAFKGDQGQLVFASRLRPDKPMVFEPRWQEALKAAKIRGFVFHGLRHSAATHLAQSGATLLEIADLLGHRTLAMTQRYAHHCAQHRSALVERVMGGMR